MSLFSGLVTRRDTEQRYLDGGIGRGASFIPAPGTEIAADYVGEYRAMANLTVYACVRLLSDTIASLPWRVYRKNENGTPIELDPQPQLMRQPYPGFDLFQWKWMVVAALALRGNSYHMVTSRDSLGHPTAVIPLHPDLVHLERHADITRWMDPTYRVAGQVIPKTEIVHIRRFTMPGEPVGLSPIRQAAAAIGMGLAAEEYGLRYFKDSANPSAVLETDEKLDDDAILRQQKAWIASHGGRRRPAVLSSGFKYKPIAIRPDESQFLETRKFQRGEIGMMFGIPPHMIGNTDTTSNWGTGIEQQSIGFLTYTLRPWLACIEQVFTDLLPRGQFIRFDTDALLRGDIKARYDAYKVALQSSWISPDEVRRKEELEPIPDGKGKTFLQPVNYAPLGFDPSEKEKPAPNTEVPQPSGDDKPQPKQAPGDEAQPASRQTEIALRQAWLQNEWQQQRYAEDEVARRRAERNGHAVK